MQRLILIAASLSLAAMEMGSSAGIVVAASTNSFGGSITGPITNSFGGSITGASTNSFGGSVAGAVTNRFGGSIAGASTNSFGGSVVGAITNGVGGSIGARRRPPETRFWLEREARRAEQVVEPPGVLRVCADPNDMPASNDKREGFANKIAELIAKDLGDTVTYDWWPSRRGYIRNTLRAGNCDVVIDVPAQYELVAASKPYYRSSYVIVTRRDQHLGITGLDDPRLKTLKIGVNSIGDNYTQTPPADALSSRGISANLVWFTTFYDDEHHPGDIVNAVTKNTVDVAVVWGPLGGYYAKHASLPLDVTMLPDSDTVTGKQFAFDQAFGVRRSDHDLLVQLNDIIDRRRADIRAILDEYGVPIASNGTR